MAASICCRDAPWFLGVPAEARPVVQAAPESGFILVLQCPRPSSRMGRMVRTGVATSMQHTVPTLTFAFSRAIWTWCGTMHEYAIVARTQMQW